VAWKWGGRGERWSALGRPERVGRKERERESGREGGREGEREGEGERERGEAGRWREGFKGRRGEM